MKKQVLKVFVILAASLSISCGSDDSGFESKSTGSNGLKSKEINFKGVKVNHRFSTTISELNSGLDKDSLKSHYRNIKFKVFSKSKTTLKAKNLQIEYPNEELLTQGGLNIYDQFPFYKGEDTKKIDELLSKKNDLFIGKKEYNLKALNEIDKLIEDEIKKSRQVIDNQEEENWKMIKKDFSSLDDEAIINNINIINDYYTINFEYMALDTIAKNEQKLKKIALKSKTSTTSGKNLNNQDSSKDLPYYDKACVLAKLALKVYNSALYIAAMALASSQARSFSEDLFEKYKISSSNTAQDTYRHIIWNILLANYYPSISSKVSATRFAKAVGDANEECGGNPLDSRAMDYHNNYIGYESWANLTDYKKAFGIAYGLSRPSISQIKNEASFYTFYQNLFIVKHKRPTFPNHFLDRDVTENEIKARIEKLDPFTSVYF